MALSVPRELQALIDEAKAEAEALKDALKAAMGDAEEVRAGAYKITWKAVTSARIDTGALRKALPDVAAAFTKESAGRRVAADGAGLLIIAE